MLPGCVGCAFPVVVLGVVLCHWSKRKPPTLGGFLLFVHLENFTEYHEREN